MISEDQLWQAAHHISGSADKAERSANRMEEVQQQLLFLFGEGYGGAALRLIELLEQDTSVREELAAAKEEIKQCDQLRELQYDDLTKQLAAAQEEIARLTKRQLETSKLLRNSLVNVERLTKEQAAWRKFTEQADATVNNAEQQLAVAQECAKELASENEALRGEHPEWYCPFCDKTFPYIGKLTHHCPDCTKPMLPTTENIRRITALEAALQKIADTAPGEGSHQYIALTALDATQGKK